MHFSAEQILAWIGSYVWPFFRISAFVMAAPFFGGRVVPMRIKIIISVALSIVVVPIAHQQIDIDVFSPLSLAIIFQQIVIGVALGFSLQLIFAALTTAGQIIGGGMGLGFSAMVDPNNGIQIPTVSQFYNLFGMLLFISLDGHLAATAVLVESFTTLPVGFKGIGNNNVWTLVVSGTLVFASAVLIALPIIISLLIVNIAFGIMTRSAPQLNIFAVGFPITLTAGFILMWITLPNVMPSFADLTNDILVMMRTLVTRQ